MVLPPGGGAPGPAGRVACPIVRIARFATPTGQVAFGKMEGEAGAPAEALTVAVIAEHPFGRIELTGERWALPDVRLLAPLLPSKIVGIGKNYAEHIAEMGDEAPAAPLLFLKPPTAVIGPTDAIRLPVESRQVDYEGGLAAVIGPTPAGVPVRIMSPGSSVITCETYETRVATSWISSDVRESCRT